jgi:glycosidase
MRLTAAVLCLSCALAQTPSARHSPEWVRSAVIYEIFPRAFSAGGNFRGVTARLDDLQGLGATVLWLMPIHPISREKRKGAVGSPYAARDYYAIDPAYGSAADLKELVAGAHRRGLKVILDVALNHTGWDSVLMKRPEFYKHDAAGKIAPPVPEWQDVAGLDYSNPALREYMTKVLGYWLREFDLDGFRCDVAFMPPVDFWEQARAALEKIKPDLMMLAEAHVPGLLVKAFDLDYAWPLHSALTDVLENGRPARLLRAAWEEERSAYPAGALHMRFSDNHDEKRAIARFGERGALAASALMFTMDGVPMLYNGMEVGDTTESGAPALFERLPIFWAIAERRPEFPKFYREIIALRRAHAALRQGETAWLENDEPDRIVTVLRRAPGEEFLVAVNVSNRPYRGRIRLDKAEGFARMPLGPAGPGAATALPALELDAWGFAVYRKTAEGKR